MAKPQNTSLNKMSSSRFREFLVGMAVIISMHAAQAQESSVLSTIPHPRLFFTEKELPMLRQQAAGSHAHLRDSISASVQAIMPRIPALQHQKSLPCGGSSYAADLPLADALIPLAFTFLLTDDPAYADAAISAMLAYSAWPSWGQDGGCAAIPPDDPPIAARMLLGMSLAYDWLYQRFTPEEHAAITAALITQARRLYAISATLPPDVENPIRWWRNSFTHHSHIIYHSVLGMAALALEGETPDTQTWLEHARRHAALHRTLLRGIADGTWHEGDALHAMMLAASLPFLRNLRALKGLDLLAHDYYRAWPAWLLLTWLPNTMRSAVTHGDMAWNRLWDYQRAALSFVAGEYHDARAQWLLEQRAARQPETSEARRAPWNVFEFLFFDPLIFPQSPDTLPTSRVFPDLAAVIWRTGWGPDDLVFTLKTGAPGGRFAYDSFLGERAPWNTTLTVTYEGDGTGFDTRHDHADANTCTLWKGPVQLTGELAGHTAEHPAYGETRVHNSVLIDGQGQIGPRSTRAGLRETDAALEFVIVTDHFNYLVSDATHRYQTTDPESGASSNTARRIHRHVLFIKPLYLIMIDDIMADESHEYAWVAHANGRISVDGNWIRAEASDVDLLGIGVLNPAPFRARIGVDEPADAQGQAHQPPQQSAPAADFSGKPYVRIQPESPAARVQFVHLLYPTTVAEWGRRPHLHTAGIDAEAAHMQVSRHEATHEILISYGASEEVTRAGYTLRGRVAGIHTDSSGAITALCLLAGTAVFDQDGERPLLTASAPASLDVTYEAPWVRVSGEVPRGAIVTVYSPHWQDVTVNGQYVDSIRQGDSLRFTAP